MKKSDDSPTPAIPFQEILDALLDTETPFPPRYLYRFSDLSSDELTGLEAAWEQIPTWRRKALIEDLDQLFGDDYLLSFGAVCRLGITDPESEIRFLSIRSLLEYAVDDLIPVFLDLLVNDEKEDIRASAATALGKYIYEGEIEEISQKILSKIENQLLAVIQGKDTALVRRRALEAMGFSSRKEMPDLIETAYNRAEDDWIASALFAMGRSYDEHWQRYILEMLNHDLAAVRLESVRAAGEIEISDAEDDLIELLDDEDEDVRLSAAWSLSQIGGQGIQEALEIMLEETEDAEEAELIEAAIDNLIFNQSLQLSGALNDI